MNNDYNNYNNYNNQNYQDPYGYNGYNNGYNNYNQPPKKGGGKELIIAVIALLVVIGAIVATFIFISGKKDNNNSSSSNNADNNVVENNTTPEPTQKQQFEGSWTCADAQVKLVIDSKNFNMNIGDSIVKATYTISQKTTEQKYNKFLLDVTATYRYVDGQENKDPYKTQYQIVMEEGYDNEMALANAVSGNVMYCVKGNGSSTGTGTTQGKDKTKKVGNAEVGYVYVPQEWAKFRDVDNPDAFQYSKGDGTIVTLRVYKDHTAKEWAQSYMYQQSQNSNITGLDGGTVTVGSSKTYTAYQVYMTFPSLNAMLITYWFDLGDGTVQYISIEGPTSTIDQYLYIPESYTRN